MKILAVGIALFHAGGRMDERTGMRRLIAFTTALQTCLKEAYVRQYRLYRAAATLEPEPTQHSCLDRLQTRK